MGGQFAPTQHPEAQTELDSEDLDRIIDKATRASASFSRRYDIDAEDLRQDVLLAFVERSRKTTLAPISNPVAYVETLARKQAVSTMMGTDRTEIRQALAAFNARVHAESQLAGRDLTSEERDTIAEQIRMGQAPGRRAPEGFHRPVRHVPLDDSTVGDLPDERMTGASLGFDPTSIAAKAEKLLSQPRGHVAARHLAWDAIAEERGAPFVAPGSIAEVQATQIRRTVQEAGGVVAVVDDSPAGAPLSPPARALLAPFGGADRLDQLSQDRVFDLLTAYPRVADDLWETAVSRATKGRRNRREVA